MCVSFDGTSSRPGSPIYNSSRSITYRLPDHPSPSTMAPPFPVQNSASQVSLPPGGYRSRLNSGVSLSSIANAMRKRKPPLQNYPVLPKNYTRVYGPYTLSLNTDHEASSGLPIFSSGAVISGSLEVSKISKMLHSIRIMVTIPAAVPTCGGSATDNSHR